MHKEKVSKLDAVWEVKIIDEINDASFLEQNVANYYCFTFCPPDFMCIVNFLSLEDWTAQNILFRFVSTSKIVFAEGDEHDEVLTEDTPTLSSSLIEMFGEIGKFHFHCKASSATKTWYNEVCASTFGAIMSEAKRTLSHSDDDLEAEIMSVTK